MRINQRGDNSRGLLETLILGHRIFSAAVRLRKRKEHILFVKSCLHVTNALRPAAKGLIPLPCQLMCALISPPLRIKLHYRTAHESSPHKIPVGAPS